MALPSAPALKAVYLTVALRARLLALLGLVSLPLFALVLYVTISGGLRATEEARRNVERLARTVVNAEAQMVDRPRHLLVALAEIPVVREQRSAECSAPLPRFLPAAARQQRVVP